MPNDDVTEASVNFCLALKQLSGNMRCQTGVSVRAVDVVKARKKSTSLVQQLSEHDPFQPVTQ